MGVARVLPASIEAAEQGVHLAQYFYAATHAVDTFDMSRDKQCFDLSVSFGILRSSCCCLAVAVANAFAVVVVVVVVGGGGGRDKNSRPT